ncbi:TPA: PIN domain nuclease [Candidatus Acetothermia bacterium]|nr:PIN domain nuclease [Candidatus Acetothermia bacterium]
MPIPRASVDTCFFLRYLTGAPPDQAEQAEKILQQAERGEIQLVVPPLVIAEIIWILETSVFDLSKQEAAEKAIAILNLRNIHVDNSRLLEEAAVLHAELNIDYTDAYLACFAKAKGLENVYTFDKKDFSKVPWLRVLP